MRILVSAYACEPGTGSEGGVGWNVVRELASRHELTVLTRANNREVILACGEGWVGKVGWEFYDPPRWLTFWKRGARGVQLFYLVWQAGVWLRARRILGTRRFDLVHHLTFGKYWVPSLLVNLGLPFVFGPVGGGESTPEPLKSVYGWKGKLAEHGRDWVRWILRLPSPLRSCYRRIGWTLAATNQTGEALASLGVTRWSVLAQSGLAESELDRLANIEPAEPGPDGRLRLVTACRLIHWKAVDLAIEAVHVARARGVDVSLTVLQDGPERPRLERLVAQLGLTGVVDFTGRLPGLEDVYQRIRGSDALIHPALHEAFGQACLESLALGVPVICLDWAGPGVIVDPSCGYKVAPGTKEETIAGLAEAILALAADRRRNLSEPSVVRSRARRFSWCRIADGIEQAYLRALGPKE